MRDINKIIVHCSYTPPGMDIGAAEIKEWHAAPKPLGRGWSDIGYHYIIRRNGAVEEGRSVTIQGAHCRGHNLESIGICLVGGKEAATGISVFNYSMQQMASLNLLLAELSQTYSVPESGIYGHNEFSDKACPCFNVREWLRGV